MKRSVRSSRVTGPKMRVPIGSSLALSSTAALRVELDQRAVLAAHALGGAHDDGVVDLALLDAAARRRFLDADLDHVADAGVAALRAAEHLDAHDGLARPCCRRRPASTAFESCCPLSQLGRTRGKPKGGQSWAPCGGLVVAKPRREPGEASSEAGDYRPRPIACQTAGLSPSAGCACSTSVLASLTSNLPGASMLSALTTPSLTSIE